MASSTEEWIEELKGISVLELSERIKALEEEFGVSATLRDCRSGSRTGRRRRRRGWRRRRRGLDCRRRSDRSRREEGSGHQGRACRDRTGPEGSQGPGRRGPEARQGRHRERRGRQAEGRPRRSGSNSRTEVSVRKIANGQGAQKAPSSVKEPRDRSRKEPRDPRNRG